MSCNEKSNKAISHYLNVQNRMRRLEPGVDRQRTPLMWALLIQMLLLRKEGCMYTLSLIDFHIYVYMEICVSGQKYISWMR